MRTLIIGKGEVGKSLENLLRKADYSVLTLDKEDKEINCKEIDIIHICFPYSNDFITNVREYQERYKPKFTVIHSTVPVGTSSQLEAIHSPIRGMHPKLEEGIRTFTKFVGGKQGKDVVDYFKQAGIKVMLFDKSETTEAMKLFDTLYFGVCIEFAKEVKRYCDTNGLNYSDVYRLPNMTYNKGYKDLGHPEFIRPVLEPIMKKIGGHCVRENAKLIKTDFSDFIEILNDKYYG